MSEPTDHGRIISVIEIVGWDRYTGRMSLSDVWLDEFDEDHLAVGQRIFIRDEWTDPLPAVVVSRDDEQRTYECHFTGPPESYGGGDPKLRDAGPSL